jgi:prepilin-type N-terminal cleavage/methylation domain-containing protein
MKDLISMPLKSMPAPDAACIRGRGFTLVELLVAMVVASIIMAAIYSVYTGLTRSYTTQNAAADVQQAVRATIDFMAEDIMMAGLTNPQEDYIVDVGISQAGSNTISFNADINMDGDTDAGDSFENITYALVGNQLRITDNSGTETLIDNVVNNDLATPVPLFRYFRENDTDTPTNNDLINGNDLIYGSYGLSDPIVASNDLSVIRTVEISLIVEEPAGREGMVQRTYTTRVRCRNIGL